MGFIAISLLFCRRDGDDFHGMGESKCFSSLLNIIPFLIDSCCDMAICGSCGEVCINLQSLQLIHLAHFSAKNVLSVPASPMIWLNRFENASLCLRRLTLFSAMGWGSEGGSWLKKSYQGRLRSLYPGLGVL